MRANAFEHSGPRAPLLLLPFRMHSALPCFKRTSVSCCLMPRLSALVPLLRIVRQMKTATNPGRKVVTVSVFSLSQFSKPHKYRRHPYGHPVCVPGIVCALGHVIALMPIAESGPNSSELHVSPTLWIKSGKKNEISLLTLMAPGLRAVFCCLNSPLCP